MRADTTLLSRIVEAGEMDSPEVLWAHTRSEHASQSPFMVPELQPDWPPGFADDLRKLPCKPDVKV